MSENDPTHQFARETQTQTQTQTERVVAAANAERVWRRSEISRDNDDDDDAI